MQEWRLVRKFVPLAIILLVVLAVVIGRAFFLTSPIPAIEPAEPSKQSAKQSHLLPEVPVDPQHNQNTTKNSNLDELVAHNTVLLGLLERMAKDLSSSTFQLPPEAWEQLRQATHEADSVEAAESLRRFLASGVDFATGYDFRTGSEGVLDSSPTLRTAALDLLGQTDPRSSIEISRDILRNTASSDEYAIALRNLAWSNFRGQLNAELQEHLDGMLQRPEWLAQPSQGFLEAFDVAVELGAFVELIPFLQGGVKTSPGTNDSPANVGLQLDRAAFMALDRIVLRDPSIAIPHLANSELWHQAPMHRISLISRLDLRDPVQAKVIRDFLLSLPPSSPQAEYFANLYPNANFFDGPRLVTTPEQGGSLEEIDARDQATVVILQAWENDPSLAAQQPILSRILERLAPN